MQDERRKLSMWCFEMDALPGTVKSHVDQVIIESLFKFCKKFSFQVECARENQWYHYQCAIDMHNRYYPTTALTTLEEYLGVGMIKNLRPMTTAASKGKQAFNYCAKSDTSVRGPWHDHTCVDPVNCPKEVKEHKFYYRWVDDCVKLCGTYEFRDIYCVIDPLGGLDKSSLVDKLEYEKVVFSIPYMENAKDMIQFVKSAGGSDYKCFTIDIPRSICELPRKRQQQFWSAIEQLKGGNLYDTRYVGQKFRMTSRPTVVLFMNFVPPKGFITADRLRLLMINYDLNSLVEYDEKLIDAYTKNQIAIRSQIPEQHVKKVFPKALPIPPSPKQLDDTFGRAYKATVKEERKLEAKSPRSINSNFPVDKYDDAVNDIYYSYLDSLKAIK